MRLPRPLRPMLAAVIWAAVATTTLSSGFTQVCAGLQDVGDPMSHHPSHGFAKISDDGSVVALTRELPSGMRVACRWTEAGGIELLDPGSSIESAVTEISGDGRVIIGRLMIPGAYDIPFRWRAQGGLERISPAGSQASAIALSFDGSVIIGRVGPAIGGVGWRWEANAFTYFGSPTTTSPFPIDVSDDGQFIVGVYSAVYGGVFAGDACFRWDAVNGAVDLGRLTPPAGATGQLHRFEGMSADGNVVVGSARFTDDTWSAFRWTPATGMTELPSLGGPIARPRRVSADGQTIVGISNYVPGVRYVATVWRDGQAPQPILDTPLFGSSAHRVSADGGVVYVTETASSGHAAAHFRAIAPGFQIQEVLTEPVPMTFFKGMSEDGSRMLWETPSTGGSAPRLRQIRFSEIGLETCRPAVTNSTGCFGLMSIEGSAVQSDNALRLAAHYLPVGSFGYFLVSRSTGFTPMPGGSAGNLCLSGEIGRFAAPSQVQQAGADGSMMLPIDLSSLPSPSGPVAAVAGESWVFQAWHRDALGGQVTSNFTTAVTVVLR